MKIIVDEINIDWDNIRLDFIDSIKHYNEVVCNYVLYVYKKVKNYSRYIKIVKYKSPTPLRDLIFHAYERKLGFEYDTDNNANYMNVCKAYEMFMWFVKEEEYLKQFAFDTTLDDYDLFVDCYKLVNKGMNRYKLEQEYSDMPKEWVLSLLK